MNTKILELRVPPVLVSGFFSIIMWVISLFFPGIKIPAIAFTVLLLAMVLAGLVFTAMALLSFRKSSTTVNPLNPEASSSLVREGVYRISRNPMYVGFLCFLIAWGLYLSNLYSLILVFGYVLYINVFQIIPEERALESVFGNEYRQYKKAVRRWL